MAMAARCRSPTAMWSPGDGWSRKRQNAKPGMSRARDRLTGNWSDFRRLRRIPRVSSSDVDIGFVSSRVNRFVRHFDPGTTPVDSSFRWSIRALDLDFEALAAGEILLTVSLVPLACLEIHYEIRHQYLFVHLALHQRRHEALHDV